MVARLVASRRARIAGDVIFARKAGSFQGLCDSPSRTRPLPPGMTLNPNISYVVEKDAIHAISASSAPG
jgi:hypothetical protein